MTFKTIPLNNQDKYTTVYGTADDKKPLTIFYRTTTKTNFKGETESQLRKKIIKNVEEYLCQQKIFNDKFFIVVVNYSDNMVVKNNKTKFVCEITLKQCGLLPLTDGEITKNIHLLDKTVKKILKI